MKVIGSTDLQREKTKAEKISPICFQANNSHVTEKNPYSFLYFGIVIGNLGEVGSQLGF